MTWRPFLALTVLLPATLAAQQPRSIALGVGVGSLDRELGVTGTTAASGTVLQLDGTLGIGGPLALTLGATGWARDDRRYLALVPGLRAETRGPLRLGAQAGVGAAWFRTRADCRELSYPGCGDPLESRASIVASLGGGGKLALSPHLDLVLEGRFLTTLHQTGGFSFGRRPNALTTVMLGVGVRL